MPAFAPSTGLASRVASGTRAASRSRALLASSGKSHAGRHPQRRVPSPALRILLPSQLKVAARRTRSTAKRATAPAPATVVSTSRCAVHPASTAHHQHRCLLPLPHRQGCHVIDVFILPFHRGCFIIRHVTAEFQVDTGRHLSTRDKSLSIEWAWRRVQT